jgi:arylsulfatase A-like enzyme
VLLITLDTTRADRLRCYGNERIETPNLDRLAREGVLFQDAVTAVPSTLPSHCSIMTGLYPAGHGVHDNAVYRLGDEARTLAESFYDAGYRTGAFISAFVLDQQFGLGQGFDLYDDEVDTPLVEMDVEALLAEDMSEERKRWVLQQASPYQRRASDVSEASLDWLAEADDRPFFAWIHYFDPHASYAPPAPWDTRYDPGYEGEMDGSTAAYLRERQAHGWEGAQDMPPADFDHMVALYDGEISYMDSWIGKVFEALEASGRWKDTIVLVVGDHGEGFGEHGLLWEHNQAVFREVTRVPLLLKLQGDTAAGHRVREVVRTVDVAPTLLAAAGLPALDQVQGRSLLPLLKEGPGVRTRPALLEALRGTQAIEREGSWVGLRDERWKIILMFDQKDTEQMSWLFDIQQDPTETVDVSASLPQVTETLRRKAVKQYRALEEGNAVSSTRGLDQMTSDALRSLGYTE